MRILLGVSGGVAAYKAAALTSTLVQRGDEVDVVLTAAAERFVTPLTFASLTGRPVYASLWDAPERIPHIRLVREAEIAVVAPATANVVAKLAHGIADDLLSTALLAARIPIVLAPAMNAAMYEHPATRENLDVLRRRGYEIVEPETGFLAEREHGVGRLASEVRILQHIDRVHARSGEMKGLRVAITAGPTRERIDPVRFVSNAATGAMGIALSAEAAARGADVTLLLGPTHLRGPTGVKTVHVTTAQELHDAAMEHAVGADIVFATAAVADWRPAQTHAHKVKKSEGQPALEMQRTPDVLAALGERKGTTFLVGFAAETQAHESNAREKLRAKRLDAIVVNDVAGERGFGERENTLTLLWGEGERRELGTAEKPVLAAHLLDATLELMEQRSVHAARH
ncbi:MAG: bifunctional phosphopantothenoylcysteine decarboxylase/phosphopantothenate--cysteine ligase CoaBC [Candidatus Eremiobacteraeota bacterium]|nr:bifunctional phosphopantothenoylcysteine decarboxylase/phosphopantothenate--cysteine ligase CoaBC [Candidatus Eremiobacteraeota bacterium]